MFIGLLNQKTLAVSLARSLHGVLDIELLPHTSNKCAVVLLCIRWRYTEDVGLRFELQKGGGKNKRPFAYSK